MTVLFVPRSTWYSGAPTSNSGSPRPRLRVPVPTITRHYTGAPPMARARTWSAQDFMPDFQRIALAAGKSYEYNYVIPPRDDGSAQVWEYAGTHRAAHSAGENDVAIGVLFAVGVTNHPSYRNYDPTRPTVWEDCTDAMVTAYRWLRDVLLFDAGVITAAVLEFEHRTMPGAATACPGQSVISRFNDLAEPYPPALEPDMDVRYFKLTPGALTVWAVADDLNATRLEQSECDARGVNPAAVTTIPAGDAARYRYHPGLPRASVQ